jgi:hypothetical protein
MAAGFIDLDVRYVDVNTLIGVAVDGLSGAVKNALGVQQRVVVPDPMQDADGVFYRYPALDIQDPAAYPGTWLSVMWQASRYGVLLPSFDKSYLFAPVAPGPADKTVIYWTPSKVKGLLFYQIRRTRGTENVLVGRSFRPSFVDEHVFPNEFDARSWQYCIDIAVHRGGLLQPDGSDYVIEVGSVYQTTYRTNQPMCMIHGKIIDLLGRPYATGSDDYNQTIVAFQQYSKDRHQLLGDTYVLPEAIHVQTTAYGDFTAALVQDVLAEIWIPFSRFRARFIVPRKSQAGISELSLQMLRE